MSDHIYRVTEIVGTSDESVAQAIKNGVARVSTTVRNVEWFEVIETRGAVSDKGDITFQVSLKVGFRLEG
ncbi:MAG: dodecin family protein [Actinomycetota bacterium]|nr:dodecin family protein [Actinomycetota bacterium]